MTDDTPNGYADRPCAVCGVRYADHFAIPSAPFELRHLHFIERPRPVAFRAGRAVIPPRARRLASRALWAELHGYEGHWMTEGQRLGTWRRAMRGLVRCPSNARRMPGKWKPQEQLCAE